MRSVIKLFLVLLVFVMSVFTISCTNTLPTTSERTTDMVSEENTSDELLTTEVTTDEVEPVEFEDIVMVNDQALVDQMLEFELVEKEDGPKLVDYYNPYDYEEIKVVFYFTAPNDDVIKQTAFWYRDYDEIRLIGEKRDDDGFYTDGQEYINWGENSDYSYRVRINPNQKGSWKYKAILMINNKEIQSLNGSFTVEESQESSLGYISVDQVNQRNFIFEKENQTYIPMGSNFAWFSTTLGMHDYYNWFKKLNEENANFTRIWLSNWSFSIHKYSYTNFDTRQSVLARLDYLFDYAKDFDVYIMLTLINHGQFSYSTNPEWGENPYNIDNGGMLEYPVQFFYNEEAKAHYKNELMYLISRFGYSENIFAWEFFNEVDWIDGYSSLAVKKWHEEMAEFVKENDPYQHMVSTSYKYLFGTPAFDSDLMDFANFHSYEFTDKLFYSKLVEDMNKQWNKYQKPVFYGEIGIDWQSGKNTYNADYTGITLHQALWGGMLNSAGSANHWWWDTWVEAYDLWYRFKGASTYAQYIDVANQAYTMLSEEEIGVTGENIRVMGYLLEDKIYGYIYNDLWNYWNRDPEMVEDVSISIPLSNGDYELLIFDTVSGDVIDTLNINVQNKRFELNDLIIDKDYAFIVR